MGSKNIVFLGIIVDTILHFHRNFFRKKDIRMSKRVQDKIKQKHHTVCSTIFSLKPETIKKYYEREDFKLFRKSAKRIIENYIKS